MKIKSINNLLRFFFCIQFLIGSASLFSQPVKEKNIGITGGASIAVGTHVNQIGLFIRSYYIFFDRCQWNNDFRATYYFRYLGPRKPHPELQLSSGIFVGYGNRVKEENFFMNKTSNQTGFKNGVGYAYNAYFNAVRTSQQTGAVSFQFGNFFFTHENDILARPLLDKFRTAAIQFGYRKDQWQFTITNANWTGKLGGCVRDTLYHSPAGYLDTCKAIYPLLSHGLLYLSAEYAEMQYFQQAKISAGVDAEQVRHAVQNRFTHDACCLPRKWRNPNNFHFPMIDDKGGQYLFREDQKIRRARLYFNLIGNGDVIY